MNDTENKKTPACCESEPERKGFFQRIFSSIDEKMKAKAEEKAAKGDCCCSDESKDNKCC